MMADSADGALAETATPSNATSSKDGAQGASTAQGDNKFQKAISAWRSTLKADLQRVSMS